MDWYLPTDAAVASQLRAEVRAYLERHAVSGSDIAGAELAFSELLTNAVEHSEHDIWVSIDWAARRPVVTIHDLGPGFELNISEVGIDSPRGRGLSIASHLTDQLTVAAKRAEGNRVSAVLNVERPETQDHDRPADGAGRLPEARDAQEGFFGREPFLLALTVELAQTVDREQGPSVAEAVIAQVGANVGGSMEAAHRNHLAIEGDLDAHGIADLFVGLKAAIGGDFYVIEEGDDRIVLGNRRCPFGDGVKHAPSLCRMTSSVFGGIASRNTHRDVAVHLEERIAVGDPECRVTIWLDSPPEELAPFVHHYRGDVRT